MNNAENLIENNQLKLQGERTQQDTQQPPQLNQLLARADIWQAANEHRRQRSGISTGHTALDALLTGHGWPRGATTELLADQTGIGEISLLLPTLAELTRNEQMVILVNPPHIPYAPALAAAGIKLEKLLILHPHGPRDSLWAIEQSLQSGCCGALLSWQGRQAPADKDLRRLQVAAREGDCLHFQFRPQSSANSPSPASLRLQLCGSGDQLALKLLKQLGGRSGQQLNLARAPELCRRDQPLH